MCTRACNSIKFNPSVTFYGAIYQNRGDKTGFATVEHWISGAHKPTLNQIQYDAEIIVRRREPSN